MPVNENYQGEVASRYQFDDGQGEIGFISSVTKPFCSDCTRARLSSDGKLYNCLFASKGVDLRAWLEEGMNDDEIESKIIEIWNQREDRYSELRLANKNDPSKEKVEMYYIGG